MQGQKVKRIKVNNQDIQLGNMNPNRDAFGQILRSYYNDEDSFEIIERDDGYISFTSGPEYILILMKNG